MIDELYAKRWSPRAFSDKEISENDLKSLFQAAKTAPSSYNEQPWRFIIGVKGEANYDKVFACLNEFNQKWASTAPVIALGISKNYFDHNNKVNNHALHDLGAFSAMLSIKAIELDIYVHQMAGIHPEKVAKSFNLPEGYQAQTALAIGYLGDKDQLSEDLRKQEKPDSPRKELSDLVFAENWENRYF